MGTDSVRFQSQPWVSNNSGTLFTLASSPKVFAQLSFWENCSRNQPATRRPAARRLCSPVYCRSSISGPITSPLFPTPHSFPRPIQPETPSLEIALPRIWTNAWHVGARSAMVGSHARAWRRILGCHNVNCQNLQPGVAEFDQQDLVLGVPGTRDRALGGYVQISSKSQIDSSSQDLGPDLGSRFAIASINHSSILLPWP